MSDKHLKITMLKEQVLMFPLKPIISNRQLKTTTNLWSSQKKPKTKNKTKNNKTKQNKQTKKLDVMFYICFSHTLYSYHKQSYYIHIYNIHMIIIFSLCPLLPSLFKLQSFQDYYSNLLILLFLLLVFLLPTPSCSPDSGQSDLFNIQIRVMWVAHVVSHLTLDFGSGHDPEIMRSWSQNLY